MFAPRWLTKLTIPVIVGAALTSSTAIALADATDDTFLSKMHSLGFTWPSGDDSDVISRTGVTGTKDSLPEDLPALANRDAASI